MSLEAVRERHKAIGRNDTCTCGSGKKYKKCHLAADDEAINAELTRLKAVADAEAAAKAEAEEEGQATSARAGSKRKSQGMSTSAARENKSAGQASARKSKGDKSQSLPRRGAV